MGATTLRAGIPYPLGTDANNFAADMGALAQKTDDMYPILREGLLSSRPPTPEHRSLYWATDDRGGKLYYGDGSSHFEVGPGPVAGPLTGFTGLISAASSALVSDVVLGVRGKVGQTGDLIVAQNSTPTTKFRVDTGGSVWITDPNSFLVADQHLDSQGPKHRIDMRGGAGQLVSEVGQSGWQVFAANTSATGLLVNTNAGQTGNLQRWQVNGSDKASISSAGDIVHSGQLTTDGSLIRMRSANTTLWRNMLSFENSIGTSQWQLVSDVLNNGSTDFGLYNGPSASWGWAITAGRQMSIHNKLTVGGGYRQSSLAVLDVQGDIGLRELDALRVTTGAAGRVVYQDSTALFVGAVDAARDLHLRAQGADRLICNSAGVYTPIRLAVGTSTIDANSRLRVDTGAGSVSESGVFVYNSPAVGWHGVHVRTEWSLGNGGEPLFIENLGGTLIGRLTNNGFWHGRGGAFGSSVFGGTGAQVNISDDGTQGLITASGPANPVLHITTSSSHIDIEAGGTLLLHGVASDAVSIQSGAISVSNLGIVTMTPPVIHYVSNTGEPAFQNSWADFGGSFGNARFWKDANGVVHLAGAVKNGVNNTVVFTLPAGYRPPFGADASLPTSIDNTAGYVIVQNNGDVIVGTTEVGAVGVARLDGMSFPTWT